MKPVTSNVFLNIIVTRIVHVDDSKSDTVVLSNPSAKQVYRHSLTIEVVLSSFVLELMSAGELQKWLTDLYKSNALEVNHKSLDTIADELSERIADEFDIESVVRSIKILNANQGSLYTY